MRMPLAIVAVLGLLVCGCATSAPPSRTTVCNPDALKRATLSSNGVLTGQIPGSFTPIPLSQVQILDPALTRIMMVESVASGRSPTGTATVMTRVVNCTDETMQIQGRAHFFTANQSPAEPASAWKIVIIPGRSIGVYQESSVATAAVANYLIELRQDR